MNKLLSLNYCKEIPCDRCSCRGTFEFFGDYLCSTCLIDELIEWEMDPDDRDILWAHQILKELMRE